MSTDPNSKTHGSEIFRPYARLVGILGDQLITNKRVGVIELVKNCYDADATKVFVRFNLNDDKTTSSIEIEDDGHGMTLATVLNVWMKPATPYKLNQKKSKENRYTQKGRLMQGDKGVGRFAVYKLGNHVEMFTKTEITEEVQLTLNFRDYAANDEFTNDVPEKFLDEITNQWQVNSEPKEIVDNKIKGTLIRITDLRDEWTSEDFAKLEIAFQRMIPPVIPNFEDKITRDFNVELYANGEIHKSSSLRFEDVFDLAPFYLEGSISEQGVFTYIYRHNKKEVVEELNLFDAPAIKTHDIWNLKLFNEQFLEPNKNGKKSILVRRRSDTTERVALSKWKVRRRPNVGDFTFFFYAFDWRNTSDLETIEKAFIRDNSVYLYRDFTRVYPYGERGIDWLMLSKLRAEDRAARYFSYNDLIGFVFITQQHNPCLRDAADREGLMNINGASDDFVALIQAALKVMKDHVDVDKRQDDLRQRRALLTASEKFNNAFRELRSVLAKSEDKQTLVKADNFFKSAHELVDQYREKLTIAQELAGVGMAVEKSSHDIYVLLKRLIENAEDIVKKFEKGRLPAEQLRAFLKDLQENLEFIYQEVQILQPLFRVARKVTKEVSVREAVQRVERYYERELKFKISFKIEGDGDIVVVTNLGLMLQVFINLTDNAIYWVEQKSGKHAIVVRIDSINREVIFADNGPGIPEDRVDVVFTEFYSTKAEGRGLGLYIVRELLDRIDARVSVITTDELKVLPGANFLIKFPNE